MYFFKSIFLHKNTTNEINNDKNDNNNKNTNNKNMNEINERFIICSIIYISRIFIVINTK